MVGSIDPRKSRELHETGAPTRAADLSEVPQAHAALAREGRPASHVPLHRLRRRGSAALARCRQVARCRATTAVRRPQRIWAFMRGAPRNDEVLLAPPG